MAVNDLIQGNMWEEYSQKVQDLMNSPKHKGEITENEAEELGGKLIVADFGAESCGDAVRLYWVVDEDTNKIKKAKFRSFGCGTAIASSDTMVDLCVGKTVDEAVKITNLDVEFAMRDNPETPAVPPQKMHCSVMAYDVIKKAAAEYKGVNPDDFEDEIMVCECARISLGTIKEVVKLNDLATIEQITDYTKAGAFCKSCVKPGGHEDREYYLTNILKETRDEMAKEKVVSSSNETSDFGSMTIVQKVKKVESILDEEIRAMLMMDGGNVEVIDIQASGDTTDIYIKYQGACNGCASSSTGTLYAIETTLKEKLEMENLRVIPL
ncbi:MAG: Iron-sulfur cluster assembly scaffold protein IscU/NifU-like [uncultured Campylobacterales bacterium]|uniref:Nitrogen fixation protein NifU n=1 Tax=uncultured Campylobacterales bacterium TaxID=352960 RepID=A0A6S6SRV4_9BACT|nr:MAG: Iron-sulfur cluster assembly scaffold protein IscU/NifU-like [uncultured Campylobacterales bacterium]